MSDFNQYDDHDEDLEIQEDQYLVFRIHEEEYGIDIRVISEIIRIGKITPLADQPEYVKGIINLRDKIIPVIDFRMRAGMELREYDNRTSIIITRLNDAEYGIIVDFVKEVEEIPKENIDSVNFGVTTNKNKERFISGVGRKGEEVRIIINLEKFIREELIKTDQSSDAA